MAITFEHPVTSRNFLRGPPEVTVDTSLVTFKFPIRLGLSSDNQLKLFTIYNTKTDKILSLHSFDTSKDRVNAPGAYRGGLLWNTNTGGATSTEAFAVFSVPRSAIADQFFNISVLTVGLSFEASQVVGTELLSTSLMIPMVVGQPPPGTFKTHQLTINFRNPFGIGEKLAVKAAQQVDAVNRILPPNFTYTKYVVLPGSITLHFTEEGDQLLSGVLIVALVAAIVVILGLLYKGYVYRENEVILVRQVIALQKTIEAIDEIVNNSDMTDEEKVSATKGELEDAPEPLELPLPPPPLPLPSPGDLASGFLGGMVQPFVNPLLLLAVGGAVAFAVLKKK